MTLSLRFTRPVLTRPIRPTLLALLLPLAISTPVRAVIQDAELERAEDARLREGINAVIDRGVAFLLAEQNRDGSWGPVEGFRQEPHFDRAWGQAALSVYTLLKCKVPRDHPAILRGIAYLSSGMPSRTYSIGCQLMALSATGDPAHRERIEELLELLLEQSNTNKGISWGYPGGLHQNRPDLSNIQYGVLGLRAAGRAGIDVPTKVWREVVEGVLPYLSDSEALDHPTLGRIDVAPFRYNVQGSHGAGSLSMTAVGIAVLSLCEEALVDTPARKTLRKIEETRAPALAWLEANFSVEKNVGGDARWLYYYLYGLERIGSLLELNEFAGRDWYAEGARVLLKAQHADGSWQTGGVTEWPPAPLTHANTCFALLFLSRATASEPASGSAVAGKGAFRSEDPGSEVLLRGTAGPELLAWLTGFGEEVTEDAGADGTRVTRVVWRLDGEVVATLPGQPGAAWENERYPLRTVIARNGRHTLEAEVEVDMPSGTRTLTSGPVTVVVDDVLEPWMLEYADASDAGALSANKPECAASTELSKYYKADQAFDGLQLSAWIAAADDAAPSLSIELRKPFRAKRLRFAQVNSSPGARGRYARAERVEILLNKSRTPLVLDLAEDELEKTELVLRKATKVRTLKITIVSKSSGTELPSTGFAEVELLSD